MGASAPEVKRGRTGRPSLNEKGAAEAAPSPPITRSDQNSYRRPTWMAQSDLPLLSMFSRRLFALKLE